VTEFRDFTSYEYEVIARLLSVQFAGRREVAQQLEHAKARTIDESGSLKISPGVATLAPVAHRVPVEAEGRDTDGVQVHVLLHVVKGQVDELEFYKADGSPIHQWPDPSTMEIFAPPAEGRQDG
jgi:hypothetical protein